ncbi:hypothetical protein GCM10010129_81140 [Streptomyces fumigatiscleroticus]|nr:hypothetical protein GCM10010129_81140 [Streptomyces fumigatiscleroticus]
MRHREVWRRTATAPSSPPRERARTAALPAGHGHDADVPEIRTTALAQLPDATALDGELIVWDATGRLTFERLQNRLARRGAGAARAAQEWPAHFVAFDLLRLSGTDTTAWPYRRRRAALESVFAARRLSAPWALCPSTTDLQTVKEWLSWASVGMEGVVFKRLDGSYQPSKKGWRKYKVRETTEAIFPVKCMCSSSGGTLERRLVFIERLDHRWVVTDLSGQPHAALFVACGRRCVSRRTCPAEVRSRWHLPESWSRNESARADSKEAKRWRTERGRRRRRRRPHPV